MSHAPGPWELRTRHTDRHVGEEHPVEVERFVRDANGLHIATIGDGRLSPAVADSFLPNARLIAAAPDLLAACETLLFELVVGSDPEIRALVVAAARAAIAKAVGK